MGKRLAAPRQAGHLLQPPEALTREREPSFGAGEDLASAGEVGVHALPIGRRVSVLRST